MRIAVLMNVVSIFTLFHHVRRLFYFASFWDISIRLSLTVRLSKNNSLMCCYTKGHHCVLGPNLMGAALGPLFRGWLLLSLPFRLYKRTKLIAFLLGSYLASAFKEPIVIGRKLNQPSINSVTAFVISKVESIKDGSLRYNSTLASRVDGSK